MVKYLWKDMRKAMPRDKLNETSKPTGKII